MCLCHSGMPLVVPFPLRWAWLHGVSCKLPERVSRFLSLVGSGPMGHVSVPFLHASGGAVPSPLGVVARCVLQIA